jgi:hypothetical protein
MELCKLVDNDVDLVPPVFGNTQHAFFDVLQKIEDIVAASWVFLETLELLSVADQLLSFKKSCAHLLPPQKLSLVH